MNLSQTISDVLRALDEAEVRYLVVGGLAVVLHGHLRTTMDLDLVFQMETDNISRGLEALRNLGYQPSVPVPMDHFADPGKRRQWQEERNMLVFSLWHPEQQSFKVDLFLSEPFDFEIAYQKRLTLDLGKARASVVSLNDLITMKEVAGRSQDLADLEILRKIRQSET